MNFFWSLEGDGLEEVTEDDLERMPEARVGGELIHPAIRVPCPICGVGPLAACRWTTQAGVPVSYKSQTHVKRASEYDEVKREVRSR